MTSSPTTSPPPKKQRTESSLISESPVKALFVPTATPSASTSSSVLTSTAQDPLPATTTVKTTQPTKQPKKKGRKHKRPLPEPFSPADVTYRDVRDFLGGDYVDEVLARGNGNEWEAPEELKQWEIVEAKVEAFTVSGESLSLWQPEGSTQKWAIITPFAHPGDRIRCRIYKNDRFCSFADLVEILEYSETYRGGEGDRRKNPDGGCKYFGECGGCQLQPVPYPLQLAHKKQTLNLAYARYSSLPPDLIPTVQPTIGSPKQWGYRTKITPHFDAPQKWARSGQTDVAPAGSGSMGEESALNAENTAKRDWECRIGFERKGRPGVMDIEECPIATPVLNVKMKEERKRIKESIMSFKKGATLLLRDSLPRPEPIPTLEHPFDHSQPTIPEQDHVAITNSKEEVYERVGDFLFSFKGGSFFQNNNSILLPLTEYVRQAIFPSPSVPSSVPSISDPSTSSSSSTKTTQTQSPQSQSKRPTHLVDTYCGSGLFSITLSPYFQKIAGVEISHDSIVAARRNAEINGLSGDKASWLTGKAEELFVGLPELGFRGEDSCVVVDPPRKGCDTPFLEQLLAFKPLTIVYVSCNVHTQARDVGWLVNESAKREDQGKYILESLRGFDLFPQTAHVESVAVLRLVE